MADSNSYIYGNILLSVSDSQFERARICVNAAAQGRRCSNTQVWCGQNRGRSSQDRRRSQLWGSRRQSTGKDPIKVLTYYLSLAFFERRLALFSFQVLAGGRGKGHFKKWGKGGVQLVYNPAEAEEASAGMIGTNIQYKKDLITLAVKEWNKGRRPFFFRRFAGDKADWGGWSHLQLCHDHWEEVHQEGVLCRVYEREGILRK